MISWQPPRQRRGIKECFFFEQCWWRWNPIDDDCFPMCGHFLGKKLQRFPTSAYVRSVKVTPRLFAGKIWGRIRQSFVVYRRGRFGQWPISTSARVTARRPVILNYQRCLMMFEWSEHESSTLCNKKKTFNQMCPCFECNPPSPLRR